MSEQILINVENISKKFCHSLKRSLWYGIKDISNELFTKTACNNVLRQDEFWAVKDVSFTLERGECLGLIGTNGSGKSTILKMLNGLIKPDNGQIKIRGKVGALIELGAGFNQILTGLENIYINASVLGLSKEEVDEKIESIIEFSGLRDFIGMPVQNYSTGMKVRLGFAIAAQLEPDVLLVDEVLAVGDVSFQRKCLDKIYEYISNGGSVILISHDMNMIQSIATKSLFINNSEAKGYDDVNNSIGVYLEKCRAMNSVDIYDEDKLINEGELFIKAVIVDCDGGSEIYPGCDITIEIEYESEIEYENVSAGISIWDKNRGIRITTTNSSWEGKTFSVKEGKGYFRCHIQDLSLMPGEYFVKAGIYDSDTSWPLARKGWDDQPISFSISNNGKNGITRQSISNDILSLNKVSWQL